MSIKDKFIKLDGREIETPSGFTYFQLNPTINEFSELHRQLVIFPNIFYGGGGHQRAEVMLSNFDRSMRISNHLQRKTNTLKGSLKDQPASGLLDDIFSVAINDQKNIVEVPKESDLQDGKINVIRFNERGKKHATVYIPLKVNYTKKNADNPPQFLLDSDEFAITNERFIRASKNLISGKENNYNKSVGLYDSADNADFMYQSGNETICYLLDGFTRATGIRLLSIMKPEDWDTLQDIELSLHLYNPPKEQTGATDEKHRETLDEWHARLFSEKNAGKPVSTQHQQSVVASKMKKEQGVPETWNEILSATAEEFTLSNLVKNFPKLPKNKFVSIGYNICWEMAKQPDSPFKNILKGTGTAPTKNKYWVKDQTLASHIGRTFTRLYDNDGYENGNLTYGAIAGSIHNFWKAIHEMMPIQLTNNGDTRHEHSNYIIYRSAGLYILSDVCAAIIGRLHYFANLSAQDYTESATTSIKVEKFIEILDQATIADTNILRRSQYVEDSDVHRTFDKTIWASWINVEEHMKKIEGDFRRNPNDHALEKAFNDATLLTETKPSKDANGKTIHVRNIKGRLHEEGNSYGVYSRLSSEIIKNIKTKIDETSRT